MANNYYGTIPSLAWILGHYFYGGKHHMWLSAEYYPYRLPNSKSSNPHLIYQDIYQPWKDRDDFDKYIQQTRLSLRSGVITKEATGLINSSDANSLKDICDKVDIVFLYPIVVRVDLDKITDPGRLKIAGSGKRGSSEYLIEDLDDSEIDEVLFLDFKGDPAFDKLVTNEINGSSITTSWEAMRILERRC
ncbi:MAG: hypothetical protein ACJ74J_10030 [Blastocatellia bacterium]